jgi:creatinine amidohydrolase/Fe(II)-dependent formamide hydrolase-like protein
MKASPEFEDNAVGNLKRDIWQASDTEIDNILKEYDVPSTGEMDRPGSYVQTTLPGIQEKKLENNDIVLIPLGSTELHGDHSVLAQDTLQASRICEAVRRYTAKQGKEVSIALPPWIYGNHPKHHAGIIGTIPISQSTLLHLLVDVMFGLWAQGLRKFIFINNHAQHWLIVSAMDEFGLRYPELPFYSVAFDWCSAVWEFFQKGVCFEEDFIHSDEAEASLLLLLAPEMMDMSKAVDTKPRGYLPDGHFNKSANQQVHRPNLWYSVRNNVPLEFIVTPEGVVGSPTKASAEKAKRPVAAALRYLTLLVDHILETFPPRVLPPVEEVTLFGNAEIEGYLKKPGEAGYKNPYRFWRPY